MKTITVESNDPVKPKSTLTVSASIETPFGFEGNSLDFGRIRKGEAATKTTVLILKDKSKRSLLELTSQSPHIAVKTLPSADNNEGRIEVEVTVKPEVPGRLNEMIAANLTDGSYPTSSIHINGTIIGNVEVTPEALQFTVDTSQVKAESISREVRVVSTQNDFRFQLLSVSDSRDQLSFEVDTLVAGEQYVIRVAPNEKTLESGRNVSGEVKVLTSDTEQPELTFRYNIIFPRP